ncbi:hypothetical protein [Desulforamulus ruminis]|uniref:hypothetical protein n=1 Tax=Desulforamulus ruminis TaxID=1564 RepID=UPI0002F1DCED|nr:hypothetical protein [Desulforamulus ruminis]
MRYGGTAALPLDCRGDRSGLEFHKKNSAQFEIIVVTGCPRFRQGQLPSPGDCGAGTDERREDGMMR